MELIRERARIVFNAGLLHSDHVSWLNKMASKDGKPSGLDSCLNANASSLRLVSFAKASHSTVMLDRVAIQLAPGFWLHKPPGWASQLQWVLLVVAQCAWFSKGSGQWPFAHQSMATRSWC
jgi:hypothetical protein